MTIEERYWKNVYKSEGCWAWTAGKTNRGYGIIWWNNQSSGAHRYSYYLHYGNIPDGLFACHHCDNPECTNPRHLFLGTKDVHAEAINYSYYNEYGKEVGATMQQRMAFRAGWTAREQAQ